MSLPESWVEIPIGTFTDVSGGGTPDRENLSYFGGDIPWATPTDITRLTGYHISGTKESLTEAGLKCSSAKLLPAGAVLLTSRATIGKTAIAQTPMSTNQGFVNLVCDSRLVINEYLARLLESRTSYLESRAGGSTFKEISRTTVAKIKLPLPTLPEQQRIVDVLRLLNELISARTSQISRLQNLIFLLFDDYFHTPELCEGSGKIGFLADMAWINPALDKPIGLQQELSFLPMAAVDDISGQIIQLDTRLFHEVKNGYTRFIEDDVLFAKISPCMENGKITIARGLTNGIGTGSTEFHVIRPKQNATSEFLWVLTRRPVFRKMAARTFMGTSGHQRVPENFLTKYKLQIPSYENQKSFSDKIRPILQEINKQEKHLELLKLSSQELTSAAFSGALTASWRNDHLQEIKASVLSRDAALKERGVKPAIRTEAFTAPERPASFSRPARNALIAELSGFQREVWNTLGEEFKTPVRVDDAEMFAQFCSQPGLVNFKASAKRIRSALEQLAALGLIAKISLPKFNAQTQQTNYVTAFRPLREEENTRLADADKLRRALGGAKTEA